MRIIIAGLVLGLSGCTLTQPLAERVANGVHKYCTTLTQTERQLTRNSINAALEDRGHRVQVNCAGDQ